MEVQWWCSPQSSVPRQTVGHHARAATYEMGLNNLRRLPCGGAQCEPDDPPTGPFHIPTDRCAGRRSHRRADVRAVGFRKTHFVWVSLKIDSRTYKTHPDWPAVNCSTAAGEGRGLRKKRPSRTAADAGRRTAIRTSSFLSSPSFSFSFSFSFPSPRIPTDRRAGRRTHQRADARAVGFRKTQFVCVSLKIDSRPHRTTFDSGAVGRLPAVAAGQERAREDDPSAAKTPHHRPTRHHTLHPPCTYPAPTLHPPCTSPASTLHPPCTHLAPTLHLGHVDAVTTGEGEPAPSAYPVPTLHLPCIYPAPAPPVASHAHPHRRPTLHLPCTCPPARATKLTFYLPAGIPIKWPIPHIFLYLYNGMRKKE
jgi:hypothetical protein